VSSFIKISIDIAALVIIYFVFLLKKWRAKGRDVLLVRTLLYIYISLVLMATLMPILASLPFIFSHPYTPMHMQPFEDFLLGRWDSGRQIVLNVCMMIPFGFLLPIVKKRRFISCVLWTFVFSLSIELLQPLINASRSSDITDVITNVIGGILGYLLYLILRPYVQKLLLRLRSKR
jgi:glycopeptide antibiotics resistance protein